MTYDSDPFGYDFGAALELARKGEAERRKLRTKADLGTQRRFWAKFDAHEFANSAERLADLQPPTTDHLATHARRFGGEGIAEIKSIYKVELRNVETKARPKPARRRRTSPTLRAQVIDLRSRGIGPAAIADQLNISDARVGKILREAQAA